MQYNFVQNVVICFPEELTQPQIQQFCNGIFNMLGNVGKIEAVKNQVAFFSLMMGEKSSMYNLCIILDDLKGNGYSSLLSNIRAKNPLLNVVIVVPKGSKGSMSLAALLRGGEYNVLCQSDFTADNLRERVMSPRSREEALHYCLLKESQISGYVSSGENEVMATGNAVDKYEGEEKEQKKGSVAKKVRIVNGIPIIRMYGSEVAQDDINSSRDEEDLGFMKNKGNYNFDSSSEDCSTVLSYDFELEPEWMFDYKEGLREYFRREGMALFQSFEHGKISVPDFRTRVYKLLPQTKLTEDRKDEVIDSFIRDTMSYGKLDVVLNHPDVSDVVLRSKDIVNVQIKGVWYKSNITFQNKDEYVYFIGRICTKNRVSMNAQNAEVYFSDIDTIESARLRFIGTDASLNTNRLPSMHIRKIDKVKCGIPQLIKDGMLLPDQAEFIKREIQKGSSFIACGGSGSGKTVLINNSIEFLDANIRGVFCQESEELFADTKYNIEFMHTVNNKGEGKVVHTLREIATAALLKNTKVFGIGEIKGDEARDFFTAANTGAQCICSLHGLNVFEAIPRIADLAMYGGEYSLEELLKMLCKNRSMVVFLSKYKVMQIARVVGWDPDKKDILYDVYDFRNEYGYVS